MNPLRLAITYVLALCEAVAAVTNTVLGPVADQIDAMPQGDQNNQGDQPVNPPVVNPPQFVDMPSPFAGESSEDFVARFPVTMEVPIPAGLKFDPWFVAEVNGVFTRGAWIPVEAPFTAPLA